MQNRFVQPLLAALACVLAGSPALPDSLEDVGHTALAAELGAALPDGSDVQVAIVEAADGNGYYMPDVTNSQFAGKTITCQSVTNCSSYSGHATSVGLNFFGLNSMGSGITNIDAYLADDWLTTGFINLPDSQPAISGARATNHSYVGAFGPPWDSVALRQIDWLIERDEAMQIAGFVGGAASTVLLGSAFNVIAVNNTGDTGPPTGGSAGVDSDYTAGRTRPHIVAPTVGGNASSATPLVSAATAMLIEYGHGNPSLSTDPVETSTSNRNADLIHNTERSEVLKAILMAAASRTTTNTTTTDITDYRANAVDQTANGLDRRFGAGQLNIRDSFRVLDGGEQNSIEDHAAGGGAIDAAGFDYDPAFGGSNGTNATATYYFSIGAGSAKLTAALVWNILIAGGTVNDFDGTATLNDMDLSVYDVTDSNNWVLVSASNSADNNDEHLWIDLAAGNYALQVGRGSGQGSFDQDFALAWQIVAVAADSDGDGVADDQDNCIYHANYDQRDTNQDGYGNRCDADLNNDEFVNSLDLGIFKSAFLSTDPDADLNGDGIVNSLDLGIFKTLFLQPPGPSGWNP